jgi:tetratricopeptide (TPR) repeat protein
LEVLVNLQFPIPNFHKAMFDWLKPGKSEDSEAPERNATPANAVRADLLWRQGSRQLEKRRLPQAIEAMRQAMELEPSRLDGRLNLGAALYLNGELEEAISHLKYVLAFEPQNTMALLNLSACYDGLGQVDNSIATLEKLIAARPEWKDAHYNLAVAYYKQKKYQSAIRALKSELQINPQNEAARALLKKSRSSRRKIQTKKTCSATTPGEVDLRLTFEP